MNKEEPAADATERFPLNREERRDAAVRRARHVSRVTSAPRCLGVGVSRHEGCCESLNKPV